MLISFEGLDGCGKSTQVQLLAERLQSLGYPVRIFREPGATPLSEYIRQLLLHTEMEISPIAEMLLFNAARAQLVHSAIRPALEAGAIVLCDRFDDSTTAYQGYGRGLPLAVVLQCNQIATDGLKPALTFVLDVPVELALQRSQKSDRMEQAGLLFFERVRWGYREIALREPDRVICVDATYTPDEVHTTIWHHVCRRLPSLL
ncbi:MAG: dTMP kinase [Candidatus Kapabacteria bacterium]|nr:dTMP kinase [Candidatus Kapabacteria bacterium]MCS7170064.1 dTMP kinase [Candidatus Kapabacteria bacterium]MDW8225303.1 dTMP kinase [Bacteroidota bacterium]